MQSAAGAGPETASPVDQAGLAPAQPGQPGLVEPLTDRELEVLKLLAQGQKLNEMAGQLYLSPNTLKAHTQNIYTKLDAHSRIEAVNRARALGFI